MTREDLEALAVKAIVGDMAASGYEISQRSALRRVRAVLAAVIPAIVEECAREMDKATIVINGGPPIPVTVLGIRIRDVGRRLVGG